MPRIARGAGPASTPGAPRLRLFSTHHRVLGIEYLLLSLLAVALGTLLSLVMRIRLVAPDWHWPLVGVLPPESYLALVTMHGTLMIFFVLTIAPLSGFANLVLPEQIGARHMAFPRLNAASFWLTLLSLVVLLAAFVVRGGAPISGWTSYPPLSALAGAGPGQALGMDLWLVSLGIFCIASWLGAVNLLVTILYERCPGMRLMRMPLTVWAWLVASVLVLISFSVLLAALLMLLCDRHAGTSFFLPAGEVLNGVALARSGDGSPLLWLHLFWFFGHPEVYIAILPGMGLTSSLLANFTRRPILGYPLMVATTLAIGALGLVVWGHHMFVSGINPYAGTAFALTTMAIAVPSAAKVLSWLGTLLGRQRRAPLRLTTPMLFALGFVSLFITGGLTGPILAQPALDSYLHNTFFVVAHFHLIMGMAGAFSIFAGVYYWFPLMSGRLLSERLGRWHFLLTFVGAYATFFPMHFAGLAGEPRHYAQLTGTTSSLAGLLPLQRGITWAAMVLATAQLLFLANLVVSLRRGRLAPANPWQATTLEWAPLTWQLLPTAERHVYRGPYEYGPAKGYCRMEPAQADFKMQCDEPAEPE
ncbi:MAG TPA: cbb3-type cytochrome c oxidase subunit I [Acidobacteriaceae bacterium]